MGAHDAENMAKMLAGKLRALPAEALAEVAAFIEAMTSRDKVDRTDRGLVVAAGAASEPAFAAVWNNPEDDVYDAL
jgi:hypothetical protein